MGAEKSIAEDRHLLLMEHSSSATEEAFAMLQVQSCARVERSGLFCVETGC